MLKLKFDPKLDFQIDAINSGDTILNYQKIKSIKYSE